MKKVLFVLLALCLFIVPVMAQETPDDPVVLNWEELADQYVEAGHSGTLYAFNDLGIRLLIPEGYEQQELSEESVYNLSIPKPEKYAYNVYLDWGKSK